MSTAQGSPPEHLPDASAAGAPRTWRGRLAYLGPGLVLAAASVGAGDMVTSLSGAADYGMALMWAILIGVTIKFALTEAIGRLYMATGRTVIASLGSVSKVLPVVFFVFVFVIGLLYGAALSSVAALALSTLVPALPLKPLAIVITLVATGIVLLGRYAIFERVMIVFTLVKFSGMVVLAIIMLASTDDLPRFLSSMRPGLPEGSVLTVLALIGGVGGTAGVAAYGYWVREKGWQHRSWLPRGPVLLIAIVLGSLIAAWLGVQVGASFAASAFPVPPTPRPGDVFAMAPEVSTPWAVLAQPLAAALVYGLAASWNGADDLGRRLG